MTYQFGNALSGGQAIDEAAIRALSLDRLHALFEQLRQPASRSGDRRLFDLVRREVLRRGGLPRGAAR